MTLDQSEQQSGAPQVAGTGFSLTADVVSNSATSIPNTDASDQWQPVEIYGSFLIDDSEFAITASCVQEVVNEPAEISPVPLSPPHMLGLFDLRGKIIPIVDLRKLLEFPDRKHNQSRKVAVIEHGNHCIGLLFDRTGEVLSEQDAARVEFSSNNDRAKDTVIKGVLKFENGERLVQILDPYELLQLERLPCADNRSKTELVNSAKGKRRTCIAFQTGHTSCALDLRFVKEVKEMTKVDQAIFANGCIVGTTNLRGVILPIIDFRGFMGDDSTFVLGETNPIGRKMLVLETAEGPIGIMVFSIDSILPYYEGEIMQFAKISLPRSDFVKGCLINQDNKIVMVFDEDKLRTEPSFLAAAKACQEIYPPETVGDVVDKRKVGNARRTFIQFTFEKKYALETSHVSEVINRPSELLEPPFSLDFVEGIIHLRGELITLFNPRLLYGLSTDTRGDQKVLIFKHGEQKFGLLVDSVDEIITTTKSKVVELNSTELQGATRSVTEDVVGSLMRESRSAGDETILILDTAALVERCIRAAN